MPDTANMTGLAARICRYQGCWRNRQDDNPMCQRHVMQLHADLTWLTSNITDLADYRINRAYGAHGDGPRSPTRTAPTPIREQIHELLYETGDDGLPGVQPILSEWARTLAVRLPDDTPLRDLATIIRMSPRLDTSPATPVYAHTVHRLVRRLIDVTDRLNDNLIVYGNCPAPDCPGTLTAAHGAREAVCPVCHSRWLVAHLLSMFRDRVAMMPDVCTARDIPPRLARYGLKVNKSTLRSWIHRGQLPQAGENSLSQPVYRLADAIRLALPTPSEGDRQ